MSEEKPSGLIKPKVEMKEPKKEGIKQEPLEDPSLPNGWLGFKSKSRPGEVYYFHKKSKTTTWQKPKCKTENSSSTTQLVLSRNQRRKKAKQAKNEASAIKSNATKQIPIKEEPDVIECTDKGTPATKRRAEESKEAPSRSLTISLTDSTDKSPKKRSASSSDSDKLAKKTKNQEYLPIKSEDDSCTMEVLSSASDVCTPFHFEIPKSKPHMMVPPEGNFLNMWLDAHLKDVHEESMDWEMSAPTPVIPTVEKSEHTSTKTWHLVVDTNVLLGDLSFVHQLRDNVWGDFGQVIVVIPWVVLQELDNFKSENTKKPHLRPFARNAISFIHKSLTMKHPRLKGEFCLDNGRNKLRNDDGILQHCLELKSEDKNVMLLTEDKNLCNKAVIAQIECQSVASLKQWLELETSAVEMDQSDPMAPSRSLLHNQNSNNVNITSPLGKVINSAESLMVAFFGNVLSSEMHNTYGDLWLRIVLVKPPWSFKDLLTCLDKHWMSVVSDVCVKSAHDLVKAISSAHAFNIQKSWDKINEKKVSHALELCVLLCQSVNVARYAAAQEETVRSLQAQLKQLQPTMPSDSKPSMQHILPQQSNPAPAPSSSSIKNAVNEDEIISNLFDSLWNCVYMFCQTVEKMIECREPDLVKSVEAKILTHYRSLKAIIQLNDKLLQANNSCDKSDLYEMKCILLKNSFVTGNIDTDPFSTDTLQIFYVQKRCALEKASENLKQAVDVISKGMSILMVLNR